MIQNNQLGQCLQFILDAGFTKITDMAFYALEKPNAEEFLEVYKGVVPEYYLLVDQLTAGPCLVISFGADVDQFREFVGPADVELAKVLRPKSVRALFGENRVKNALHVTDLKEDGKLECEYFFKVLGN